MGQWKSFIQIIIIIIKEKEKKGIKFQKRGRTVRDGRRGERGRFVFILFFFFYFLSKIYGNRTVDFCRSRRQSWSTRRELSVGTKSLAFCHTSRGRKFSYLCYFKLKCYVMA